jgi:hypothetical protein
MRVIQEQAETFDVAALVRIQWRAHVGSALNTVSPVDLGSK